MRNEPAKATTTHRATKLASSPAKESSKDGGVNLTSTFKRDIYGIDRRPRIPDETVLVRAPHGNARMTTSSYGILLHPNATQRRPATIHVWRRPPILGAQVQKYVRSLGYTLPIIEPLLLLYA